MNYIFITKIEFLVSMHRSTRNYLIDPHCAPHQSKQLKYGYKNENELIEASINLNHNILRMFWRRA